MTETAPVRLAILPEEQSAEHSPPSSSSALNWYNLGYFSDFLYLVVVIAVALWIDTLQPFNRPIDKLVREDTDLAHPHLENIVSNVMLWIYAVVVPVCVGFVFFAVSWILGRLNSYDASFSLHLYIISLFLAIAITGLVTNIFKIWGGRFRPDFLDRCKYDELAGKCTGDEKLGWFWLIILVLDGRKSWPSGHSSLCFAGLGFLGMWFFGLVLDGTYIASDQMNVFRRGYLQNRPGRAWRFILPFAPWLWAAYVAISRTQQYVHHPTDVLSGAVIGFVIAAAIYFLYFRRHEIKAFNGYESIPS